MPFAPGKSGNPSGGRKRTSDFARELFFANEEQAKRIIAALGKKAEEDGDTDAARVYLDRVLGKPTEQRHDEQAVKSNGPPMTAEQARDAAIALMGQDLLQLAATANRRPLTDAERGTVAKYSQTLVLAGKVEGQEVNEALAKLSDVELAKLAQEKAAKVLGGAGGE